MYLLNNTTNLIQQIMSSSSLWLATQLLRSHSLHVVPNSNPVGESIERNGSEFKQTTNYYKSSEFISQMATQRIFFSAR